MTDGTNTPAIGESQLDWMNRKMAEEATNKNREEFKQKMFNDPEKGEVYKKLWDEGLSELADKDPNILDSPTLFVSAAGTVSERLRLKYEEEERKKKAAQQENTPKPEAAPAAGAQPASPTGLGTPPQKDSGTKVDLADPTLTVKKLEAMGVHQTIEGRPITDADLALLRVLVSKRNRRRR